MKERKKKEKKERIYTRMTTKLQLQHPALQPWVGFGFLYYLPQFFSISVDNKA
jgi:hypothetical protein